MRVLVVEDHALMRRVIMNGLRRLGFNDFLEAENGQDALIKLYSQKVDLLITDWLMPEMDGIELIKTVRHDADLKNMPILMITSRGEKNDVLRALRSQADDFIVKPFTPDLLCAKVKAVFVKMGISLSG